MSTVAPSRPVDELAREPALADAGLAVDRDERRAAVAHRARERVLEQLELGLAADERRREAAQRRAELDGADDALRGDRLAPAAQLERLERLELDAVAERAAPRPGRRGSRSAPPAAAGARRG